VEAHAVTTTTTSRDAWLALEHVFNTRSQSYVISLHECLSSIHKGSTSAASYLQTIFSIVEELTLIGHSLDDFDLIIYSLSGLDDFYRESTTSVQTRDTPLTIDKLFVKLLYYKLFL